MFRQASRYKDHPRITWFGIGGTVAYVDYVSATASYFIGRSEQDGFKVIAPSDRGGAERHGFASLDAGIEYALAQAGETPR